MARFLLRDGHKISADVNPTDLDVISYGDLKGHLTHAVASMVSEKYLLEQIPTSLQPLLVSMKYSFDTVLSRTKK